MKETQPGGTYEDAINYLSSHPGASQTTTSIAGKTVTITKKTATDGTTYYEASQSGTKNTFIMDEDGNMYVPINNGQAYYYTDQNGEQHFMAGSGSPSKPTGKTAGLTINGDLVDQISVVGGSKTFTVKSVDPGTGLVTLEGKDRYGNYLQFTAGDKADEFKSGDKITVTLAKGTGVFVDNGIGITNTTATGDARNQGLITGNLTIEKVEDEKVEYEKIKIERCSYVVCEDGENVTKRGIKPCPSNEFCSPGDEDDLLLVLDANPKSVLVDQEVELTFYWER